MLPPTRHFPPPSPAGPRCPPSFALPFLSILRCLAIFLFDAFAIRHHISFFFLFRRFRFIFAFHFMPFHLFFHFLSFSFSRLLSLLFTPSSSADVYASLFDFRPIFIFADSSISLMFQPIFFHFHFAIPITVFAYFRDASFSLVYFLFATSRLTPARLPLHTLPRAPPPRFRVRPFHPRCRFATIAIDIFGFDATPRLPLRLSPVCSITVERLRRASRF